MSHKVERSIARHIVFIGGAGTGKSSAINLILGTGILATVANDAQPCTQASACYKALLMGETYNLWDTPGLDESRNLFRTVFEGSSKKQLKKFLKERHQRQEIDLLVFCVHGSRVTKATARYYKDFCVITRRLAAPVVIMITHLEKESDMEGWWLRNSSRLRDLSMEFDDHAGVTALLTHPRLAESRRKLVDLIAKNRSWQPKGTGSYFGSHIPRPFPSVQSRNTTGRNLFKAMRINISDHSSLHSRSIVAASPSFHTAAESPRESVLPSPVVQPPSQTPCEETTSERLPRISTNSNLFGVNCQSQFINDEASSMESPPPSMFHSRCVHIPHTEFSDLGVARSVRRNSSSEVHPQHCMESTEDHLNELPFEFHVDNIRRRKNYASHRGVFGDIWECDLILPGGSPCMVMVKVVKTNTSYDDLESHKETLDRELMIWKRLQHKNVVPLLGVVHGFGPLLSMVTPWFSSGSLSRFLAHHQMLKILEKNRLLADIAAGLCYLHGQNIVHGDLSSDNVMIDEHGTACLTEFGLSFISEFVGTQYLKSSISGGVQFADPALVQRVNNSQDVIYPTKPCDVYSFGGIILHVMFGKKPFDGISQLNIFMTVLKGGRPIIPTQDPPISASCMSQIRLCWDHKESIRPTAEDLVKMFPQIAI